MGMCAGKLIRKDYSYTLLHRVFVFKDNAANPLPKNLLYNGDGPSYEMYMKSRELRKSYRYKDRILYSSLCSVISHADSEQIIRRSDFGSRVQIGQVVFERRRI